MAGKLITVEGIDGAGKSTLAAALVERISQRGMAVRLLREPGGVAAAERIRSLVQDPELTIGARSEALLYAAARAQLIEQAVKPLLESGTWVLLDRFVDSSLAYQGAGRQLGIEQVRAVNHFATGGLVPDRTLLLKVSGNTGRARQDGRGGQPDRLEQESAEFFARTADAYRQLAEQEPERIRAIDAEQPPEAVLEQAVQQLEDLLR